jgi:hypothetical protein
MKKFIIGILIGMCLMLSASVYADDIKTEVKSLIGMQVEGTFPIQINNSQLQSNAIVVDNTSYLPVRTIAELFNSDVSFIDNQVILKAKDGAVNLDKLAEYKKDADTKQAKWEKDRLEGIKQQDELNKKLEEIQKGQEKIDAQSKANLEEVEVQKKKFNDQLESDKLIEAERQKQIDAAKATQPTN